MAAIGAKDLSDQSSIRYKIVKKTVQFYSFLGLMNTGYTSVVNEKYLVDYSQFLGPDWEPEWEGASTLISKHISWIDIIVAFYLYYPMFTATARIRDMLWLGNIAKFLNIIFIERVGADSKAQKKGALAKIQEHQHLVENRKFETPLMIYPEGATSRESELLQFKIGAFLSLTSIQPFSISYKSVGGIRPDAVMGRPCTAVFINSCMPPFGTIINKTYPVFRPNEYFWTHHLSENESKA